MTYAESHPDQQINPDLGNLLDYINYLENEGSLKPHETRQLGGFIIKACESVVVDAIQEYATSIGRVIMEETNGA